MTDPPRYATDPERTVPLPAVALTVSVLLAPVGLVLGIVALRRVRRDGEDGAGTAVTAIVVGAVLSVAYLVLAVTLVVLYVLVSESPGPLPPGLG